MTGNMQHTVTASLLAAALLSITCAGARCADDVNPICKRAWAAKAPAGHWPRTRACKLWYEIDCADRHEVCVRAFCVGLAPSECTKLGYEARNAGKGEPSCCIKRAAPGCTVRLFCTCPPGKHKVAKVVNKTNSRREKRRAERRAEERLQRKRQRMQRRNRKEERKQERKRRNAQRKHSLEQKLDGGSKSVNKIRHDGMAHSDR
eukprot:IDg13224t1